MASPPPASTAPSSDTGSSSSSLLDALADALPAGYTFGVYHLSTPPTRTAALFHAPPGCRPDRTYCESHFLSVTIDVPAANTDKDADKGADTDRVLVFAFEVLVFSTAFCTTVFVSKADSSGALSLLRLPRGAPSPVRAVAAAFVAHLVAHRSQRRRRRMGQDAATAPVQTVVSLFARAQAQYLFPRSVENPGKHVLDDRGLVRWWCRVLDPLVAGGGGGDSGGSGGSTVGGGPWASVRGYLMVPGLEPQETLALLPRARAPTAAWVRGHPLEHISHYVRTLGTARVPPRCLVAQFPDDPKSRFRDELDDEAEARSVVPGRDTGKAAEAQTSRGSASASGAWKSVRTLDQFWDMMAFRQECSSGRMTGFLWVVFDPAAAPPEEDAPAGTAHMENDNGDTPTPKKKKRKRVLRGRIVPRVPRIKTAATAALHGPDGAAGGPPTTTAHYAWPRAGRGARVVAEHEYKRAVELLLLLDFASRDKAVRSTRRWLAEVGSMGRGEWRRAVTGRCAFAAAADATTSTTTTTAATVGTRAAPANLTGLVKRKRASTTAAAPEPTPAEAPAATVRVLSSSLVRKKPKPAAG